MADDSDSQIEELEEPEQPTGFDELLYALGTALRSKRGKEAVAGLLESYSADIPRRSKRADKAVWMGYGLAAFAISVVAGLGYLEILDKSTLGTLMGAIVGSLFYRGRQG